MSFSENNKGRGRFQDNGTYIYLAINTVTEVCESRTEILKVIN